MCNVTQLTEILRIPPLLNEVKAGIVQKYVMLLSIKRREYEIDMNLSCNYNDYS